MIKAENVSFEYFRRDDDGNVSEIVEAVKDLSIQVRRGEFIGILGRNGSGKSTFAKLLNALLEPTEGTLTVDGMSVHDQNLIWEIRQTAGMVFQNPDNQMVGTIVEEDVAFGPENLGLEPEEIERRVKHALQTVSMSEYAKASPNRLSGGQKQRVAVAGILAMNPKCMIFDEATAMLDPQGRREVLQAVRHLNKEQNITVLYITHDIEEVLDADRLLVLHEGKLVLEGTPSDVLCRSEGLQTYGLQIPHAMQIADRLRKNRIACSESVFHMDALLSEINRLKSYAKIKEIETRYDAHPQSYMRGQEEHTDSDSHTSAIKDGLIFDHVSYVYHPNTVYAVPALRDITLQLAKGDFLAIIGHTGSGKSTLIQHFNGLLQPTEGHIYYEGEDIYEKGYRRVDLRAKIGLVFQYPEHQLFAETVLEDVSFGPKNLGLSMLEVQQRAFQAIQAVGLEDTIYDMSPFELSGGQKRRVAIAGVLAMQPDVLVLDEPAAGLDAEGKKELLDMIKRLNEDGMTIVLVSHNMEDVAEYAKRVVVMSQGQIAYDGSVPEVFRFSKELRAMGLDLPYVTEFMMRLRQEGHEVRTDIYRINEAVEELTRYLA